MKCFYGEVHAHTNASDGKGTPEEAYIYARDVGKVDYFAVTDHNFDAKLHDLYEVFPPLTEKYNAPGKYAPLFGYEMTYNALTGYYGHANILQPKSLMRTSLSLSEWYDKLAETEETGIGQFNHPGEKWGNFNDFVYDPRLDHLFKLMELRITEYGIPTIEEEFDRALYMGWHFGPVSNEDTHAANWTTAREEMGCVLAEELTQEAILDAMRHCRTYATTDRSLQLYFKANGYWLGSVLNKTGSLRVTVDATTEKDCGIGVLQLVGEHNVVLASRDFGTDKSAHWEITLNDDQRYTYVRRLAPMQYAITAPVWVEQKKPAELTLATGYKNGRLQARAEIKNTSGKRLEKVTVSWYPACQRVEKGTAPAGISTLPNIEAGKTGVAGFAAPIRFEDTRLIAVVKGEVDGVSFSFSDRVYLSPFVIDQLFPNTKSYAAKGFCAQPYCCFDIYNRTDVPLDLSGHFFRVMNASGSYKQFCVNRTLAPHGTLTVWMKGVNCKTLDDFNRYYATTLTDEEVYQASETFSAERGTVKLVMTWGDETIQRAWVRADGYRNAVVGKRDAFLYKWNGGKTSTLEVAMLRTESRPHETFLHEDCALSLPRSAATATVKSFGKPFARKNIGRVAVLSDGSESELRLTSLAKKFFPNAHEIRVHTVENDGKTALPVFMFKNAGPMLTEALAENPEAVLISLGSCDALKRPGPFFKLNFNSYTCVLNVLATHFKALGKRVYLTLPKLAREVTDETREDMIMDLHMVERSTGATLVGVPEMQEIDSNVEPDPTYPVPRENAKRVALIGDQFTEGQGGVASYGSYLQKLLGDGYDVQIFAKGYAKATTASTCFMLDFFDKVMLDDLAEWQPEIIVNWFAMADMKPNYAADWEGKYGPAYEEGYHRVMEHLTSLEGAEKHILISPFRRIKDDARVDVAMRPGGQNDVIQAIAEEYGASYIDILTPTDRDRTLVAAAPKDVNHLNEKGTELLASLVANAILG